MENTKQLEDEETKNMTTIKETIKRQRQLTCQVMEEIEQLWEETQRQRDENDHLKTKTEEQQEDIDTLGSEKHEQHLLTERLSLQIENIVEKLEKDKNAATHEKIQLQKMWAEIYQERETLERRRKEIISERHKLEMIKYDKTTSQESKEPEEAMERDIMERLVAEMNKNKKTLLEAKQEKEQVQKNMADIKQELKRNRKDISHYRDQIEHIKQNVTVNINKMKQRWTKIQMDVQMQKATVLEMESKEIQKKGRDTFDTVRMKFSRIREEIQKLWDVLEDSEPQLEQLKIEKSDSEKQRPDTDVSMKLTQWETEMQWQKQDIENQLAQVQSERDDIERTKTKMQMERENIERERQLTKAEMDAMKCMRETIERQKQELDDRLQRTKRERRELEVMNTEIEIKKNDLVKMIRMSRRKKEEISKGQRSKQEQEAEDRSNEQKRCDSPKEITQPEEHQFEEDNMEASNENEVKTNLQSVIFEVEEIRKKLRKVREDADQRGREVPEEKSQIKWMNFRAKKKQWELDQRLEKTLRERDELEIVKIKIHGQREEVEQKLEDAATTIVTMGVMKANIEKAAAEISSTREEMLKVQRKMEENKEEVKRFMDKLNSMKAWVSKWILTEPAIKKTFSVNTSKFQESQKETHKDTLKDPTLGNVTDKKGAEEEITKDAMFLQQSITSEDQHQSDKIKDEEHMHSEHKQKQECRFFAVDIGEEQNVFLQVQTEIYEEILMDENQTELTIHLREKAKVEKQILKLKETEEKIKEQMEYDLEDMQKKNEEIKRLVMEINNLQSQRPETGGNVEEGATGVLKETEHKYILRVNTNVFKHEIFKYIVGKEENGSELKQEVIDESDLMRMEFEEQKQSQEVDEGYYKKDPVSDDIQRLRAEIYKTQEIIRLVVLELENQAEESNINKDHKEEDGEVQRLLQDIKQFQELLKMVKAAMMQSEIDLKEEMNNMKWMKICAKKKRRELDQRFEKTLRERDELDVLRIKLQKLTEMTEQKLEKMANVKKTMEKMAAKTRMKSEDVEITIKQTKVKQRQIEDMSCKIEGTKQALENSYLFLSQERAGFEKFKAEIRQLKNRKSALENIERQNGNIRKHVRDETDTERDQMGKEIEGMENEIFRLRSENEKLEENIKMIKDSLDQKNGEIEQLKRAISQLVKQKTERKDSEILKKQIQVESENVRVARQQAEAEIHEMNCLRENTQRQKWELDDKVHTTKKELREMELLKLELEIKKKENEQMFRKSMRKKQECETMWNEIQREKKILRRNTKKLRNELDQRLEKTMRERDELEVLRIKLQRQKTELADEKKSIKDRTVHVCREHKKQSLEKKEVESIREKAEMVNQSSKVTNSITDLENMSQKMHVHLEIIRGGMGILENVNAQLEKQVALQAENRTVRDNMSRVKSQIKMDLEKITIQMKAERDEIVHMRADIQKQKQELEIRLEKIKTERREMEVLKSELEIKKRENQQMQKGFRKEQEVKNMWAEAKGEKAALKREKQKWGKELDQRLQRIIKERDELEIMKLKLQIEKGESKSGMKERFPTQTQKHWEIIQTFMERFKFMKKHSEDLNGAIKDEKQHMEAQAKIMTQIKEEMEDLKMEIKRKKEMIICALKNMQQKQTHLDQLEMNIMEKKNSIEKEKEKIIEKSEELLLREKELEDKMKFLKAESMLQQKEKLFKRLKKTESENKRKPMQTQVHKPKEIEKEDQSEKESKEEKVDVHLLRNIKEKIPSKDLQERLVLQLNEPFEEDIKEKKDISKTGIQLHEKPVNAPRKKKLQTKRKTELGFKETDHENTNLQKDKGLKNLPKTEQFINKDMFNFDKMKDEKEINQIEPDEQDDKDRLQTKVIKQEKIEELEPKDEIEMRAKGLIRRSDMVKEKEHLKHQCRPNIVQNEDLEQLKAELKQERADLKQINEKINKERLDLELMRSDIQRQNDVLEKEKQDIKEGRNELEITKAELEKKKKHVDSLFDEIDTEKANIKHLTLQVKTERNKFENVMNMITLKQKEQELKENEFKILKQELETSKNSVLTERGELDVWGKDLQKKKEEVDIAMNSISGEREQLSKMKTDNDKEREILLIERDRIEVERSELKIKEDQLIKEMKSMETLKVKLQRLNNRISEDMKNKMDSLQRNCEGMQILYATLEQKVTALDGEKEKMAYYTELLEREKEGIAGILSDVVTQRQDMENQCKLGFELEKQDLEKLKAVLKQERGDLDRVNDLELMRSDIQIQCDLLEKEKRDIKEEKDKLENIKTKQQSQREDTDSHIDEMNHDKQELYQMKTNIEKKSMEEELSKLKIGENQLTSLMISIESLRAKFKQLNQRINEDFRKHMDRLEQKHGHILQLKSILELKCDDLDKQKNLIIGYCDLIQREKKYVVTMKVDMAVQTKVVANVLQEEDTEKQDLNKPKDFECGKDGLQAGFVFQTEELVEEDYFTDEGMSKRDYLRNIWKDTKTERKEIDQLKRRGHEMRNNLEKRLTVINQFFQRILFQKEKEPLEKRSLKQGLSNDTTSQSDCNSKALDKKYIELQQLKIQMLSEIEKLHVKEKVSMTLTTSNKANQTSQVDITTEDTIVQVSEEASTKMYQETEAAPETTSGLLCQLRHYCYRCCCPCCACCKQVCPEEK